MNNEICEQTFALYNKSIDKLNLLQSNSFESECLWGIMHWEIQSPIEQLFFTAFKAIQKAVQISSNYKEDLQDFNIFPQYQIGKYRTDFLITHWKHLDYLDDLELTKDVPKIIVELDGHDFHDKDEKQRRYEKTRDRFLQSKGYTVLHYTGKEVVENPYKVAAECIAYPSEELADRYLRIVS